MQFDSQLKEGQKRPLHAELPSEVFNAAFSLCRNERRLDAVSQRQSHLLESCEIHNIFQFNAFYGLGFHLEKHV